MSINKTLAFCFLILSFALIFNLFRDVQRLIRAEERIVKTDEGLEKVKEENKRLKKMKDYYQSDAFLEKQLRNKLQMAKPGETIVILPEKLQEGSELRKVEELGKAEGLANWEKWLRLFK